VSAKAIRNIGTSVRQRMLNKARQENRPFQELLQYYAMERFLYRLSVSSFADRFILKGALLLRVWHAPLARPTMDIDMLGKTGNAPESSLRRSRCNGMPSENVLVLNTCRPRLLMWCCRCRYFCLQLWKRSGQSDFFRTIGLLRIHGGVVMKNQRWEHNRCFYFLIDSDKIFVTRMLRENF
jgi:hypothetical protein